MTRIAERKTTVRCETSAHYRGRPLMITLEPHQVVIREKGRRQSYAVPWAAVLEAGMKLEAIEARKQKAERRRK